jgi:nucleoid-associated protein YgaU
MNKTIGLFLFFICHVPLGCVYAQTTFEERMHEIYKTSYSTEVSDELWDGYLNNMSLRTYNVTAGDTLWDLSLVFFGDGNYWSKIWSYNQTLTNPHLISVGQEISFSQVHWSNLRESL